MRFGLKAGNPVEAAAEASRKYEMVQKLRQVDVVVLKGQSVAEAVRSIGVMEVTYYPGVRSISA